MTVAKLIERLSAMPADCPVLIQGNGTCSLLELTDKNDEGDVRTPVKFANVTPPTKHDWGTHLPEWGERPAPVAVVVIG